jgi:Fe-S-cluster containining protein
MTSALRLAVLQMYAEVDREVAEAGPVCVSSGRCCRFKEYDHTLFVSSLEADVLLAAAPAYDPASVTADFCPFQQGNLCTAREPRPLACRVYYCDPSYVDACHAISEKYLRRLKGLADEHGVGWHYAPLHTFLKEGPPAAERRRPLGMVEG